MGAQLVEGLSNRIANPGVARKTKVVLGREVRAGKEVSTIVANRRVCQRGCIETSYEWPCPCVAALFDPRMERLCTR